MSNHYTFGDDDRAAARLALLATVFEPSSRRLLGEFSDSRVGRALDLGCGPGHSTELLHATVVARETFGLDASERLIERARARLGPPLSFGLHDVTRPPFPVSRIDLAFARHLLAHLASPKDVLTACAGAVRSGGRLVLEETGALDSPDAVFATYYTHVRTMQRHYGQDTFVGKELDRIAEGTPWMVEHFEHTPVMLDAPSMARLHAMNVRTWSRDAFAVSAFDARTIASMTEALDAVAAGERDAPPVRCVLGQAVLHLRE
jgi:trans-aconitate 2-methyltransferase